MEKVPPRGFWQEEPAQLQGLNQSIGSLRGSSILGLNLQKILQSFSNLDVLEFKNYYEEINKLKKSEEKNFQESEIIIELDEKNAPSVMNQAQSSFITASNSDVDTIETNKEWLKIYLLCKDGSIMDLQSCQTMKRKRHLI